MKSGAGPEAGVRNGKPVWPEWTLGLRIRKIPLRRQKLRDTRPKRRDCNMNPMSLQYERRGRDTPHVTSQVTCL